MWKILSLVGEGSRAWRLLSVARTPAVTIVGTTESTGHGECIFWYWVYPPQRALPKAQPRDAAVSAPEILGHLFRLVAAVVSFEFVVVAVRVVGAFIVVVFVDEDAFLVGEGLVAVPAPVAFTAQDEEPEY